MKLKIKVREITKGCMPEINPKGDLIDLRAADNYEFKAPQSGVLKRTQVNGETESHRDVTFDEQMVRLGVAMELPKGMMAKLRGRSSLTKKHGVMLACSGEIDNCYNGNNDEWLLRLIAIKEGFIEKGTRIAQFEVVPSQKATMWQKLKWLFSSGVKLVQVDKLENKDRNGFGSTGIK